MHNQVKTMFTDIHSKVTLTLNCWTSQINTKSFLGITAHWINSDWRIQEIVFDFLDISDIAHTGINLAKNLEHVIQDRNLSNGVLAIVTDNASNNDLLFENLNCDVQQIRCFGHILNLVVQGMYIYMQKSNSYIISKIISPYRCIL